MEERIEGLFDQIKGAFGLKGEDIKTYSGLTLAYIGDGIYDLIIRSLLVSRGNAPVGSLHKRASQIVKAPSQSRLMKAIEQELTKEEEAVYKRGRNAKSATSAKNASIADYRTATGFEALMGYLYLTGRMERALALTKSGLEKTGEYK